jgi:protein gp37
MSWDIWNPVHGCFGKSEGCENCYAKSIDDRWKRNFFECKKLTSNFRYPIQKDKQGNYKVPSGMVLRVCMNSDFFFEGLDSFRDECWDIMAKRPDVIFYLLTKRPERVVQCLPKWWDKEKYPNIMINVTCENQKRADERLPILKELPFKRKGIMCAPLLEDINLEPYISEGWIENVNCGGENYSGARACYYEWVKHISDQCASANVKFTFIETGTNFWKDNIKQPNDTSKVRQAEKARALNINIKEEQLLGTYQPTWGPDCYKCGNQPICQGLNKDGICN